MVRREYAVEIEGLGKSYRLWPSPWAKVRAALTLGTRTTHTEHHALSGVSLRLEQGAALGIVGANGAGKSTLLKILSGSAAPSVGRYRLQGRVAALLELGCGFHPDFTGRENVLTSGVLLGATRREMRALTPAILEFAELEGAADLPLRAYSTGMAMRLGFATAMGLEPQILILDEVFAVGDLRFQQKCVERLVAFHRAGGTLLLASHSLYDVRQMCDQALWLRDGAPAGLGEAGRVTNDYAAWHGTSMPGRSGSEGANPGGDGPRILSVTALDGAGCPVQEVRSGQSLELHVAWEDPRATRTPLHLGLTFTRSGSTLLAGLATHLDGQVLEGGGGTAILKLPSLGLLAGRFTIIAHLLDEHGLHRHHERGLERELVVRNDTRELGLVRLEHAWRIESTGSAAPAGSAAASRPTLPAPLTPTPSTPSTPSGNPPEETAA